MRTEARVAVISETPSRDVHTARLGAKLQRELGRVLQLLNEPDVEDVMLNPDSSLWVKRHGQQFECIGEMPPDEVLAALSTVAAWQGTVLNHDQPILSTELPIGECRLEAIVSPVVRNPTFAIRKAATRIHSLEDYACAGILGAKQHGEIYREPRGIIMPANATHLEILRECVRRKRNILVAGSTGSGKTTFVNALLNVLPQLCPDERVVTIEDTLELRCPVRNYVALHAIGSITMLDCLRSCMRLKPDRIVVGEVRGQEAHTLLKAWNTGHPGGMATVHANDAHSALTRLESLAAESTSSDQRGLIGEAINLVVFIGEMRNTVSGLTERRVREVMFVHGFSNGSYQTEHV